MKTTRALLGLTTFLSILTAVTGLDSAFPTCARGCLSAVLISSGCESLQCICLRNLDLQTLSKCLFASCDARNSATALKQITQDCMNVIAASSIKDILGSHDDTDPVSQNSPVQLIINVAPPRPEYVSGDLLNLIALEQKLSVGGVSSATSDTHSNPPVEMNIDFNYGTDFLDIISTSPNPWILIERLLSAIMHNDTSVQADCASKGTGNETPPPPHSSPAPPAESLCPLDSGNNNGNGKDTGNETGGGVSGGPPAATVTEYVTVSPTGAGSSAGSVSSRPSYSNGYTSGIDASAGGNPIGTGYGTPAGPATYGPPATSPAAPPPSPPPPTGTPPESPLSSPFPTSPVSGKSEGTGNGDGAGVPLPTAYQTQGPVVETVSISGSASPETIVYPSSGNGNGNDSGMGSTGSGVGDNSIPPPQPYSPVVTPAPPIPSPPPASFPAAIQPTPSDYPPITYAIYKARGISSDIDVLATSSFRTVTVLR
ncbi:hypothetical protein V8F20_011119 [Naviculisporaceae sp. PSN 640]